jgi:predicted transcriptional regulator/N-acetylglutamate synthase-like GNAT family acetyltransferase
MAPLKQDKSERAGTLFPLASNIRVARLGKTEAADWTDEMNVLKRLIDSSEAMYPGIGCWFKEKVLPGLKSEQRIAWVAFEGERAIASAVLKLGRKAKFCHLRVDQDYQDMDLGQMFFSQMTLEARHDAKEIHFTLPESLWSNKAKFFQSFGFAQVAKSHRQYRRVDTELSCSAPFLTVWSSVMNKLPALAAKFSVGGYSLNNKILISIKPKYAGRILAGSKLFEVRKKFSNRWVGYKAVLYSSTPQRALVGEATVSAVTSGPPKDIWAQFGTNLGCSSGEFEAYVGSASRVSAIELSDVIPYRESLSLAQMSHLVREDLRPPQSFCDLRLDDQENAWVKAVSVASLLHGRFGHARALDNR